MYKYDHIHPENKTMYINDYKCVQTLNDSKIFFRELLVRNHEMMLFSSF